MKNVVKLLMLFLCLAGSFSVLKAQIFTLSGEFRPRTEYRHGYKSLASPDMDAPFFTSQRTRLNLDYKNTAYQFFISLQDVRVWGTTPQLASSDGESTTLHQAYAKIFLNENFSLKAGRQEIAYDDQRIFGSVGWADQARSHDAFVFNYMKGKTKADLGLAFNFNMGASNYTALQYLWVNNDFGKFNSSLLFLNNGLENDKGDINYSQTIGTRSGYKSGKFAAFVNLYYQTGTNKNDMDINASLIGLDIKYKVSDSFSAGAGYERQSGTELGEIGKEDQGFTPFYGTNHKFNGHMDYFYVGFKPAAGLQDYFVNMSGKAKAVTYGAAIHYFMTAADIIDSDGKTNKSALGTEVDLNIGFPLAKGVGMKLGYSHMLPTDNMPLVKGGNGSTDETSNWAWMMIVVKPTLFTSKKE